MKKIKKLKNNKNVSIYINVLVFSFITFTTLGYFIQKTSLFLVKALLFIKAVFLQRV